MAIQHSPETVEIDLEGPPFGLTLGEDGRVGAVVPGSVAETAAVPVGAVILEVDSVGVDSKSEILQVLNTAEGRSVCFMFQLP